MGKARNPLVTLESHYDRLAATKLTHAYQFLFPDTNRKVNQAKVCEQDDVNKEKTDEDDSNLRAGLL